MRSHYLITLLFLLVASNSNILSGSDVLRFAIMLLFLLVALLEKSVRQRDLKIVGLLLFAYVGYIFLRNIFVNHLPSPYLVSDLLFFFKYIFFCFLFVAILKEKVLDNLVVVMAHLTLVSFFFYSFQLLGFGETIYALSEKINLSLQKADPNYTNFLVFSVTRGSHEFRNSGFLWEPGAFGCFLIMALLLNLLRNDFELDRRSIIFIIGIITTLSTTAYTALMVLLFLVYRYKNRKRSPMLGFLLIIPVFALLIFEIPFLGEKVLFLFNKDMNNLENINDLSKYYLSTNKQMPLNRFASVEFVYEVFGPQLILGIGNRYTSILSSLYNVNLSNGVIDLIAKFGLLGFFYLTYCYVRFCKEFLDKKELVGYAVLILLIVGFGSPILYLPLFLMFLFLPYYPPRIPGQWIAVVHYPAYAHDPKTVP